MASSAPLTDLSLKEVAALAGTSEKVVRNEIAHGVVTSRVERKGKGVRRVFDARAVYYFALVSKLSLPLPADDRRDLFRIVTSSLRHAGRWSKTTGGLRHAELITISTAPVDAEYRARLNTYERGLRRIESRSDILGGEPVFKGTRLSVRHIGGMANRNVPVHEILEDYPVLSEEDIAFARIYAAMKPDPGRPTKRLKFERTAA